MKREYTEDEILEMIKKESEEIEVPESLAPENIAKRLRNMQGLDVTSPEEGKTGSGFGGGRAAGEYASEGRAAGEFASQGRTAEESASDGTNAGEKPAVRGKLLRFRRYLPFVAAACAALVLLPAVARIVAPKGGTAPSAAAGAFEAQQNALTAGTDGAEAEAAYATDTGAAEAPAAEEAAVASEAAAAVEAETPDEANTSAQATAAASVKAGQQSSVFAESRQTEDVTAGGYFTQVANYGELEAALKDVIAAYTYPMYENGVMVEAAPADEAVDLTEQGIPLAEGGFKAETSEGGARAEATASSAAEVPSESEAALGSSAAPQTDTPGTTVDFGETNLREIGVDEGDIVKTDGKYLYVLRSDGTVYIVSANRGELVVISKIEREEAAGVTEMYLTGDRLVLVGNENTSSLTPDGSVFNVDNHRYVTVRVFDIADRSAPKRTAYLRTEGSYHTSRLVDGYLYLLTDYGERQYRWIEDVVEENAVEAESAETAAEKQSAGSDTDGGEGTASEAFMKSAVVPKINDEPVAPEDILLPPNVGTTQGLLIAAIRLSDGKVTDTKAIVSWTNLVYVSPRAIFLTSAEWVEEEKTQVVRIDYEDGSIRPSAAVLAPGYLDDTFAMDEAADGTLRMVTTTWNQNGSTQIVSTYDKSLVPQGELRDLAPGEELKGVRYLGDICYLVTYRNMDPLFSVDLSDPKKPELLGELEIPGFSDYLHPWGEGLLLGLGYDTDAKTGAVKGLKLSMFDISDPLKVTETDKLVIPDMYADEALNNYKSILAAPTRSLIGFGAAIEDWQSSAYVVITYGEDGFTTTLKADCGEQELWTGLLRGTYIGDTFYVVTSTAIRAYDIKDTWTEIGSLEF